MGGTENRRSNIREVKRSLRKALSRVEPEMESSRRKVTWEKVRIVSLCIDSTNVEYSGEKCLVRRESEYTTWLCS